MKKKRDCNIENNTVEKITMYNFYLDNFDLPLLLALQLQWWKIMFGIKMIFKDWKKEKKNASINKNILMKHWTILYVWERFYHPLWAITDVYCFWKILFNFFSLLLFFSEASMFVLYAF